MSTFSKQYFDSSSSSIGTKCKEFKPEALIIDLLTIIKCDNLDEQFFLPYLRENIDKYIKKHWGQLHIVEALESLRNDSYTMRFRKDHDDCPLVDEEDVAGADGVIESLSKFMKWQIEHRCETAKALSLQKKILQEALDEGLIKIPIFGDVKCSLKKWQEEVKLKMYIFASLQEDFMKQILLHTKAGNIMKRIDGLLDSTLGAPENPETYHNIARQLKMPFSDVLLITSYGKMAKAANLSGGSVILVKRPNMRLREYYQTKFPVVESLDEIVFLDKVVSAESLKSGSISSV